MLTLLHVLNRWATALFSFSGVRQKITDLFTEGKVSADSPIAAAASRARQKVTDEYKRELLRMMLMIESTRQLV